MFVAIRDRSQTEMAGAAADSSVEHMQRIIDTMGAEDRTSKQAVYLVTFSRVLPDVREERGLCDVSTLSRQEIANKVRDAWDHPLTDSGRGRPRVRVDEGDEGTASVLLKIAVFREIHVSGDIHYHAALKLARSMRFRPAKAALRERHQLASHWSCTHSHFYSTVRYCHIPSESKPEVDNEPYSWGVGGVPLDLCAESQEPFISRAWKRRREENDKKAAAGLEKQRAFTKLDLTAVIVDQQLQTKAEVLAYTQDHGTASMQTFVHQAQRKLKDYLEDAAEWSLAREAVQLERESAWALLCRTAETVCPHGDSCGYAACATEIFERNADHLSRNALALSLRQVIMNGPSKTTRTPLIVGSTNTGKTTLVLPFDKLFGFNRVFHKPALGSKFALRNLMKDKKFLFWDDFRPVQYAQETIPTSTLLSLFDGHPFEIQVSQSFNDGNVDFEWRRGTVVTAKEEGLWATCRGVTEEDVRHLQSRFEVFRCAGQVSRMRDVEECPCHMARWIRDGADEHDSRAALLPLLPTTTPSATASRTYELHGFGAFAVETRLSPETASTLQSELLQMGAINVRELPVQEWTKLVAWRLLKSLEQRRVLAWLA